MPAEDKVSITVWMPPWVKQAFRRGAYEQGVSVSMLAAGYLEDACEDDPQNPRNQARAMLFVTDEAYPPPCLGERWLLCAKWAEEDNRQSAARLHARRTEA
jgi:hypothetical protein